MKKNLTKTILFTCTFLTIFATTILPAYAVSNPIQKISVDSRTLDIPTVFADDIVIHYRWHNGVLQYRRFNNTTHEWVDPHWINV